MQTASSPFAESGRLFIPQVSTGVLRVVFGVIDIDIGNQAHLISLW